MADIQIASPIATVDFCSREFRRHGRFRFHALFRRIITLTARRLTIAGAAAFVYYTGFLLPIRISTDSDATAGGAPAIAAAALVAGDIDAASPPLDIQIAAPIIFVIGCRFRAGEFLLLPRRFRHYRFIAALSIASTVSRRHCC